MLKMRKITWKTDHRNEFPDTGVVHRTKHGELEDDPSKHQVHISPAVREASRAPTNMELTTHSFSRSVNEKSQRSCSSAAEIIPESNTNRTSTVKQEIFVGEKFRTFPFKTVRMEFNFVLSNWPKKGKSRRDYWKACMPGWRKFGMEIIFVLFSNIWKLQN